MIGTFQPRYALVVAVLAAACAGEPRPREPAATHCEEAVSQSELVTTVRDEPPPSPLPPEREPRLFIEADERTGDVFVVEYGPRDFTRIRQGDDERATTNAPDAPQLVWIDHFNRRDAYLEPRVAPEAVLVLKKQGSSRDIHIVERQGHYDVYTRTGRYRNGWAQLRFRIRYFDPPREAR